MKTISPSDLKNAVDGAGSLHFTPKTMRFFGDTMANYGVRDAGDSWELFRRKPVKHGLKSSAYFDKHTFQRVFKPDNEVTA